MRVPFARLTQGYLFDTVSLMEAHALGLRIVEAAISTYCDKDADRFGTCLFAKDAAGAVGEIVDAGLMGVAHITGQDTVSMYSLARLTTPDVLPMRLSECQGLPFTRDMTLESTRWKRISSVAFGDRATFEAGVRGGQYR